MGFLSFLPWIGVGVNFVWQHFRSKPAANVGTQKKQNTLDAPARLEAGPEAVILGRARTEGRLVYSVAPVENLDQPEMSDKPVLHRAYALSRGECDGLEAVWINGVRHYLEPERDYLYRGRGDTPPGATDGDDEPLPGDEVETDETLFPPGVVYRFTATNDYSAGANQWRLTPPNRDTRPALDSDLFTGSPANPRIARVQWRVLPGATSLDQFQLVFLSSSHTGSGVGPSLVNQGDYSLILRSEGQIERFPLPTADAEPYDLEATVAQAIWLSRFPRVSGQVWDVALINHTEWDVRIWGKWEFAFANRSQVFTETGAFVPVGAHQRTIRFYPYMNPNAPARVRWWSLRRATAQGVPADRQWTDDHRLDGVAGVHVEIIQPGSNFWNAPPALEFLVRGLKMKTPGGRILNDEAVAEWTDNAAAVRWWWMVNVRGIPPSRIDLRSVYDAIALCGETLTYEHPERPEGQQDAFEAESRRYTINGIFYSDDDRDLFEQEMDFAWFGRVEYANGTHFFRPGRDYPAKWSIAESDLLETPRVQLGVSDGEDVSGVQVVLSQSRDHGWAELDMTPAHAYEDTGRIIEIGKRALVADPLQAARISTLLLRREREQEIVSARLTHGPGFVHHSIRVGDVLSLAADSLDEHGGRFVVAQRTILYEDWSVRLDLIRDIEWSDEYLALPSFIAPPSGTPDDAEVEPETPGPTDPGGGVEVPE